MTTFGFQVTFDAASPGRLAQFWAVALGYRVDDPPTGFQTWEEALTSMGLPEERWDDASALVPVHGQGPRIFFQKVPEQKTAKNRVHLDVNVGAGISDPVLRWDAVQAHVDRLIGEGATIIEERNGQFGEHFVVLADPEGNEFCLQ